MKKKKITLYERKIQELDVGTEDSLREMTLFTQRVSELVGKLFQWIIKIWFTVFFYLGIYAVYWIVRLYYLIQKKVNTW